ncbi:MAG: hypothetical protein II739_01430 [Clostridia bacterium]|nr:hypothetical protein [Clostridia bacterium]
MVKRKTVQNGDFSRKDGRKPHFPDGKHRNGENRYFSRKSTVTALRRLKNDPVLCFFDRKNVRKTVKHNGIVKNGREKRKNGECVFLSLPVGFSGKLWVNILKWWVI